MTEETNQKEKIFDWESANGNDWVLGIVLILAGGFFMLDTFDILDLHMTNWWAVFILIPGLNMAVNGFRRYRETGAIASRNSMLWGLALILVAFRFTFNFSWNLVFPVVLIGLGGFLLFSQR